MQAARAPATSPQVLTIGPNSYFTSLMNIGEDGAGLMNITGGGQVTVNGQVNVGGPSQDGQASGSGTLNLSGNASLTVATNNPFQLGNSGGTATMTIGGNASVANTYGSGDPQFIVGNNGDRRADTERQFQHQHGQGRVLGGHWDRGHRRL